MNQQHTHQTIAALNKEYAYISMADLHNLCRNTYGTMPQLKVRIEESDRHIMLKDEQDRVVAWSHKTYPQLTPIINS